MFNNKENNFFTDFDTPFELHKHDDFDLSALAGKYEDVVDTTEHLPDLSAFIDDVQASHTPAPVVEETHSYQAATRQQQPAEEPKGRGRRKRANNEPIDPDAPRPKRKSRGVLTGILYFTIVLAVSAMLAAFGWIAANDVLALTGGDGYAYIYVCEDRNFDSVVQQLSDEGLIQFPWLFRMFANFTNATDNIAPGTWLIREHYDYRFILASLRGRRGLQTVFVTIPEGWNLERIFRELDEAGVASFDDLMYEATYGHFDTDHFWFLEHMDGWTGQTRHRLEGYLFPSTYEFFVGENPNSVIRRFLNAFRFNVEQRWDSVTPRVGGRNLSMHEVITIASMIERETPIAAEREYISSVIMNRLGSANFPFLEFDSTIVYAWAHHPDPAQVQNIHPVLFVHLEIDSPFNTYRRQGLPAGPIASPGIAAIRAAMDPADSNYFFFVGRNDGTGNHTFTRTLAEHNRAVARYFPPQ